MAMQTMIDALEPQINSPNPEERKLARRLRIERRCDAVRKAKQSVATVSGGSVLDEQSSAAIVEQLEKSTELLQQYLQDGEEYITNIRIANDSREVDRRESEGINREKVMNQLDDEAAEAERIFLEITNKWEVIQEYNDPLHIHEDMMNQKEKCMMLIKQKDEIIAMLTEELKNAEKQFTKDQQKQNEDISVLSSRIEKQITFMRKTYRHELEIIEKVILQERKNLIDSTDKKWDELYKNRENLEISNSEKKFEQLKDFEERMQIMRMDFQEHVRETKIKLENDIDELQRELEHIKALALLNSEKLDYNYQILKKREDENIIIKSQQKRRMNKLQDVITDLHNQIADYESSTSSKIKKLSENVKKLHNNILDVEAKADHFAHVNDEKFHKIWEMNKKEVQGVLTKILQTDRILYEQHLGLDWESPPNYIIDKRSLPSYRIAMNIVDPKFIHEIGTESEGAAVKIKQSLQTIPKQSKSSISTPVFDQDEKENKIYRSVIKHILTRISDKSGFLAEKRLKSLLKGYEDDQKDLVRLDHVFSALGIQGSDYINVLIKHFLPYTYCSICQGSRPNSALQVESNRTRSDSSHVSYMFTNVEASKIPELEDLMVAIRQPEDLMDAIVADMVTADEFFEESSSDLLQVEDIDDICGSPDNDQYSTTERTSKEKIRIAAHSKSRAVATGMSNDKYFCQVNHHLVISSVYVLKALREFVATYYVGKTGMPTVGERLEHKRITISRYLSKADIKLYWDKFKLNFNEDKVRVWDALLAGLKKYHEILKDRKQICDDVVKLRKENAELKRLLANYLDHGEVMEPYCGNPKENIKTK